MNKKKPLCTLLFMIITFSILAALPAVIVPSASGWSPNGAYTPPDVPNWNYQHALNASDSTGDTQGWSTNATIVYGNGSIDHPENGAFYDPARDLERLLVTYTNYTVYFRLYVNDLVNETSLKTGAVYQIQVRVDGAGKTDCQDNGRTFTVDAWQRSIMIQWNSTAAEPIAWIKNPVWQIQDDTNSTAHDLYHWRTGDAITAPGNMTISVNYTGNYVEISAPWENFIILGNMPTTMKFIVLSFKPGQWVGEGGPGSPNPFLHMFDPGCIITSVNGPLSDSARLTNAGMEWNSASWPSGVTPPNLFFACDAADTMPGNQGEIDWTRSPNNDWDEEWYNTVNSWLSLNVILGPRAPVAKFTYSPVRPVPDPNTTITFDASSSLQGFNSTHFISIANYTWDFDDGTVTTTTSPTIAHAYTDVGKYNVTLTVTCEDDATLITNNIYNDTTWHIAWATLMFGQAYSNLGGGGGNPPEWWTDGYDEPYWDYEYALKWTDPENDTQDWSTNATIVGMGASAESNAEYDAARDITAFWVTYDTHSIYFRVYARDLVSDASFINGTLYAISISYLDGLGDRESQWVGRTYTATEAAWERDIMITIQPGASSHGHPGWFTWMTGPEISDEIDDTHEYMTMEPNYDENYIEITAGWGFNQWWSTVPNFIDEAGLIPLEMKITVASYKPGEWGKHWPMGYRRCFDPQAPGTDGIEQGDPNSWGTDAADVLPGDATELNWSKKVDDIGDWNTVDGWLNLTVDFTGEYPTYADFTYDPSSPWAGGNVEFNASISQGTWNGTAYNTTIINYYWDFNDTTFATTPNPTIIHQFASPGTYYVTLNVTDNQGNWDTRWKKVSVASSRDMGIADVTRVAAPYYDVDYAYPKWYAPPPGRTRAPYKVNVTVKNFGSDAETNLDVGVYFKNATYTGVIGTSTIANLAGGAETTLTFTWDLTASVGCLIGKATIFANVTVVPGDRNATNNEFTDGDVFLKWLGDTDGAVRVQPNTRRIDIADVGPLVVAWKETPGDPNWDSRCDYNMDGEIDTWDVSFLVIYWYTTYTDKLVIC